jgi:hypothetical protein
MNNNTDAIKSVNPMKVSRKYYLEPIAKKLKLNPTEYKNRSILHQAILQKLNKPSSRCENACDPITLENIDVIPTSYLFEWDQNNKHYCADIRSLKAMIEKNQTILPWAIDNDTGISHSSDKDSYLKKYDLKHVPGLIKRIENANIDDSYDFDYDSVSDKIKYRFQIENSTTQYITHIIDFLENTEISNIIYYKALNGVCNQYNGEMYEGGNLNIQNVMKLSLLSQIGNTVLNDTNISCSLELLVVCINTIKMYFEENSQSIIDLFFMTLNEFIN